MDNSGENDKVNDNDSLKTEVEKDIIVFGSDLIHDGEVIEQMLLLHSEGVAKVQQSGTSPPQADEDEEQTDNEFEVEEEVSEESGCEGRDHENDYISDEGEVPWNVDGGERIMKEEDDQSSDDEEVFTSFSIFEADGNSFAEKGSIDVGNIIGEVTECSQCEKKFMNNRRLNKHMRTHDDAKGYRCATCNEQFSTSSSYQEHLKGHGSCFSFICSSCGKQFKSEHYLKMHETSHHNQYVCTSCKRKFSSVDSLKRHKSAYANGKCQRRGRPILIDSIINEEGQEVYKCRFPHCDKTFKAPSNVYRHEQTHITNRGFACNICGKTFNLLPYLNQHMKSHDDTRSFICQFCGKKFVESWYCRRHELTHGRVNALKCKYCSDVFSTVSNLKRHQRKHTGEKPYQCGYCGKSFSENGTLQRHERIHTGFKPYSCKTCGKKFAVAHSLRRHSKTHATLRPFQCELCPKAYVDSLTLQKHLKAHEKDAETLRIPSDSLQIVEEQNHENIIQLPLLGSKEDEDTITSTNQLDSFPSESLNAIPMEMQVQTPVTKAILTAHPSDFLGDSLVSGPFVQQVQLQDGRHVYATVWGKDSVGNWKLELCKPQVQSEVEVKTVVSTATVLNPVSSSVDEDP